MNSIKTTIPHRDGHVHENNRALSYSEQNIKLAWELFFLFLLLAIYISTSYSYNISDHNEQIPIIKRLIDSSYLMNDWFVNQNDGFTVRWYFSSMLAYLANFADLSLVYFSLYVVSLILIIVGIYLISHFLFDNNLTSFLTIFLILFSVRTALGGNWIVSSILVPSTIANAFALFAIYFFMKKRLYISFLFLGIASLFQILVGMLLATILIFYLFITIRNVGLKKILLSIACYLSFAIWNIVPIILSNMSSDVSGLEVMKIIGYERHPWHYMPFQFNTMSYLLFISIMLLFIASLKYKPEKEKHKMVIVFISTILAMCAIGTIFVEIIPTPTILKLQLFKTTPYLILFAYIYIANYFRVAFTESDNITNTLIIIGTIVSFHISYSLIIFSLLYISYNKIFKRCVDRIVNKIGSKKEIYLISLLLVLTFVGFYFTIFSHFYHVYLKIQLMLMWLFIFLFIILSRIAMPKLIKINEIALSVSLVSILLIATVGGIYYDGCIQIKKPQKDFNKLECYEWIRLNTPKDAVFISPPYIEDFRLGADRAIVVDFKAFTFKDQSIIEWRRRIADVTNRIEFKFRGNRGEELRNGFMSLNESDIIGISKKYHAQYIFIENPQKLKFKVLYENENYTVYTVPNC